MKLVPTVVLALLLAGVALGACGDKKGSGGGAVAAELAESKALLAKNGVAQLRQAVDTYYVANLEVPETLDALVAAGRVQAEKLTDPWGRPYAYERKGPRAFEICSRGADEASDADDVCDGKDLRR
ncbi:MAG: type II secretion system protein GspG [Myxococcales bacterium]|nr:type II secretion system protein GspG [Myxococcales bacterium]MCB9734675.1 type II secretion system protein GspG [Deltaproteobacteria bacterium]